MDRVAPTGGISHFRMERRYSLGRLVLRGRPRRRSKVLNRTARRGAPMEAVARSCALESEERSCSMHATFRIATFVISFAVLTSIAQGQARQAIPPSEAN